ncbi:uncharacterized protein LOC143884441 [Tasmannia lanceolata]|uniref:uncharacterized protein LOC143884441 n=1 Tax=Tasmannia lanceolata TaxID=3420 RepID=UPI004064AC23
METLAEDSTLAQTLEIPVGPDEAVVRVSCSSDPIGMEAEKGFNSAIQDNEIRVSDGVAVVKTLDNEIRVSEIPIVGIQDNGIRVLLEEVVIDSVVTDSSLMGVSENVVLGNHDNGARVFAEEVVLFENGNGSADNGAGDSSLTDRVLLERTQVEIGEILIKGCQGNGIKPTEQNAPIAEIVSVLDEKKSDGIGDIAEDYSLVNGDLEVEAGEELGLIAEKSDVSLERKCENGIEHVEGSVSFTEGVLVIDKNGKEGGDGVSQSISRYMGAQIDSEAKVQVGVDANKSMGADVLMDGTVEKKQEVAVEEEKVEVEEEEETDEETDSQEHQFSVGDFVWGKIKSHPWWPGQVYDPSEASECAGKYRRRNRLLVAYFGEGTFAWSYPSQLKPFREDFEPMSKQSTSKSFLSAVEEALDEFGKCLVLEMTCSCVAEKAQSVLARPFVANAGIREGVVAPKCRIDELSITEFQPENFLVHLRGIAQVVSISDILELSVMKSRLSAFYGAKGYGVLPKYHHDGGITGLKDNGENILPDNSNFNGQTNELTPCPAEEDLLTSSVASEVDKSCQNSSQNEPLFSEDKIYQRKKQRSMAELMGEKMESEVENDSSDAADEGTVPGNQALPSRKPKKTRHFASPCSISKSKDVDVKNDSAVESSKFVDVKNDSVVVEEGVAAKSASLSKKRKRTENLASPATAEKTETFDVVNEGVGGEEGTVLSSSRERKRSKYLSYPYISLGGSKKTISPVHAETEVSKVKKVSRAGESIDRISGPKHTETEMSKASMVSRVGESISRIAGQLTGLSPTINSSGEMVQKKITKEVGVGQKPPGVSSPPTPKVNQKRFRLAMDDAFADKMLLEFRSTARNTQYLKGGHSPSSVKAFFTRFRSSSYLNGSDYETYKKYLHGSGAKERKSSAIEPNSSGKYSYAGTDLSEGKSGQKKRKSSAVEHSSAEKVSHGETDQSKNERGQKKMEGKDEGSPYSPKKKFTGSLKRAARNLAVKINHEKASGESPAETQRKDEGSSQSPKKKLKGLLKSATSNSAAQINHKEAIGGSPAESQKKDEGSLQRPKKRFKGSLKSAARNSHVKMNHKESNGENPSESPAALLLTFAPGFAFPSKDDLIKNFRKFGVLNESETEVLNDSACARVVFARGSDAEEAFNKSEKISAFGSAVASYRLRYLSANSKALENGGNICQPSTEVDGADAPLPSSKPVAVTPLLFIKQNLEKMMSTLAESGDKDAEKLSPEVTANLAGEIKGLLKKVTTLVDSSS